MATNEHEPKQPTSERRLTSYSCHCGDHGNCERDPALTWLAALHLPSCGCACHDEAAQQTQQAERRVTP